MKDLKKQRTWYRFFRPSYTAKTSNGKELRKSERWWIAFRDHQNIERRIAGFKSETDTHLLLEHLGDLRSARIRGTYANGELVESFDAKTRAKLIAWDLIRPDAAEPEQEPEVERSLSEYIEAWRRASIGRGNKPKYANPAARTVTCMLIDGCDYQVFSKIRASTVNRWLAAQGFADKTCNQKITALRNFCLWVVEQDDNSYTEHPANKVSRVRNPKAKRPRRALSLDDLLHLLRTTAASNRTILKMTGPERALLYRTAAETGLRQSELRALKVAGCRMLGDVRAHLRVKEDDTKGSGNEATLRISAGLAAAIDDHIKRFQLKPSDSLFRKVPVSGHASATLQKDLAAAGIPFEDAEGERFDFHCFRGEHATLLALGGASVHVCQKRLRHADSATTVKLYLKLGIDEVQESAVAAMPDLDHSEPEAQKMAG